MVDSELYLQTSLGKHLPSETKANDREGFVNGDKYSRQRGFREHREIIYHGNKSWGLQCIVELTLIKLYRYWVCVSAN